MFLKVTRSKNYTYLQIVESFWEDGQSKHRVIANLGSFTQLEGNPVLEKLGRRMLSLAGEELLKPSELEIEEEDRLCYGDIVYKKLWQKLGIGALVNQILKPRRLKFDFENALYLLIIERLMRPESKLATFEKQDRYLNIEQVELQHLYRVLDVLADSKDLIERHLFEQQRDLFSMNVDVVFFDLTTFHFESVRADELKDFGYSKAGKYNEVQVFFSLLVNSDGRPVGFDLYPGNTFEGNTLIDALEKLSKRFSIRKLIFVADSGLNSGANLNLIRQAGYEYIVTSPLKKQSKSIVDALLDPADYHLNYDKEGTLVFKYKWLDHRVSYKNEEGKRNSFADHLLVTWNPKRAERDNENRQRQINKAEKMLEKGTEISSGKGAARYLKTEGKTKITGMDTEKIDNDQRWDGYYGIQCYPKMDHQQVLQNRSMLWKIEDSFRVMKSTMETRPIFHWTPQRIKGHFTLCFMAFMLERTLELKLRNNSIDLSPEKIREALNSLELSRIKIKDRKYYLKSKAQKNAGEILKAFRIKSIQNLTPEEEFTIE